MRADEVYVLLKGKITKLTEEIKKTQDWKPIHFVASVKSADDLPESPEEGDMYNIETDSVYGAAGMNVVWTADGWDPMGPIIDLTPYLTKKEAEKLYQPKGEYLTAAEADKKYQKAGDYLSGTDKTLSVSVQAADAEADSSHTLLIWLIVLVCIAAVAAAGVMIVVKRKEEKN